MSEDTIIKLATIITPAIVTIVGLFIGWRLKVLDAKMNLATATIASAHGVILQQNEQLQELYQSQVTKEHTFTDAKSDTGTHRIVP